MYRGRAKLSDEEKQSKRRARVVLIASDIVLFKLVYEYRLLRREHFSVLTGRPLKRLHRRLLQLVRAGYLSSIKLPQQRHIYGLGRLAVPILVEEGIADPEFLEKRSRTHELKPLFLKHEMMIVDLHATLALATRGHHLRLVAWREGRELHESVTVQDGAGVSNLAIRPDALFTLEDSRRPAGKNHIHVFLEADRSTENHNRFRDKLRAYFHCIKRGWYSHKLGVTVFRVLSVATTDERANNLAVMARSHLPERGWKYYLFGSQKHFSVDNPSPILEAVHFSPRDVGCRFPLVPPPATSVAVETV